MEDSSRNEKVNLDNKIETPQTLEQLDTFIKEAHEKKEKKATYFLLSLLFPPFTIYLALFFAYRKQVLYRTLPLQLIFYSTIMIVFNMIGLISVKPPSSAAQLGVKYDPNISSQVMLLTIGTTVLAIVCLAIGFYFNNKGKKDGSLDKSALWILFLTLNLLVYGVIFLMAKEASLLFGSIASAINTGYEGL